MQAGAVFISNLYFCFWFATTLLLPNIYAAEPNAQDSPEHTRVSLTNFVPSFGKTVPELAGFDQVMTNYMAAKGHKAGTIALMKDGKMVLRQAYGWRENTLQTVAHPDNLFRLASVSKVITMSAINKLIKARKITLETRAYDYLGIGPFGGKLGDERIKDITVQHLLEHTGGWVGGGSGKEWVYRTIEVSKAMGLDHPANAREMVSWVFAKPLDFAPGSTNAYSNIGYQILGRIIEKAAGKSYIDYLQQEMFSPASIHDIVISRTRPADLHPMEIWYLDNSRKRRSAIGYPSDATARFVDGGYYYESFDSFGGLSASAPALCEYMQHFWVAGERRRKNIVWNWNFTFFGKLPGCTSVIYQDVKQDGNGVVGLEYAALFNSNNGDTAELAKEVVNHAKAITSGPAEGGGEIQWYGNEVTVSPNEEVVEVKLFRTGAAHLPVQVSYGAYPRRADTPDDLETSKVVTFQPLERFKVIRVNLSKIPRSEEKSSLELISASGGAWLGKRVSCQLKWKN